MKRNTQLKNVRLWGLIFLAVGVFSQCNEDFTKVIPKDGEEEEVDVVYGSPKVLLLVVDGARGQSVRDADIPNMNSLLPKSIHTWSSLSEENALSVAVNWTDLITGVNYRKHGVVDNDFSNNKLETYPSIFSRIVNFDESSKIDLISPNQAFLDNYGEHTETSLASQDEDVKNKVIASLGVEDKTMIAAHFEAISKAGLESGFDLSFPAYRQAIETFDEQVGEIVQALEKRENFQQENWLVVITSSQGGTFTIPPDQDDNTVFSNPALNTFTIMYSPVYGSKFIDKPYIGNRMSGEFLRFNEGKYGELQTEDNDLFDLGSSKDFTIELKVKKNRGPNNNWRFNYASLIGKKIAWQGNWGSEGQSGMYGWVIHLADDFWIFNARGDQGTGEVKADQHQRMNDASWNALTIVGLHRDGRRFVRLYTNGVFNREGDITDWGNLDSDARLRIGLVPTSETGSGWRSDVYMADVKFWNIALPEDMVQQYSCEIGVDPNHPYYANVAGYWPMIGGASDGFLMDDGPLGLHLKTGGEDYGTTLLNDYICAPSTEQLGQLVPRTYDVTAQIISWLKIPRQLSWQLDGRVWLDK
ncbi:alkaline phosphatase family protein [Sphingobacterium gobiense]|uniref:DUF4983 domain-containing protein n=1 Tax=Sphingobacterium gobiense TaxID=1382456 RepID=A0A2S9JSQ3_9SPHI|nr:alkaline phosphatase family protein [Sphingobacterium gobiense]PRD56171.1 hypothetical protein C5749_02540 [Sphingobacterium gobiense]